MQDQRAVTEELLTKVSGNVRAIVKDAQIARDEIIQDAAGDYEQFMAELPEYLRNPDIFISRRMEETYAQALDNETVNKFYIPSTGKEIRITVPPGGKPMIETEEKAIRDGGSGGFSPPPRAVLR